MNKRLEFIQDILGIAGIESISRNGANITIKVHDFADDADTKLASLSLQVVKANQETRDTNQRLDNAQEHIGQLSRVLFARDEEKHSSVLHINEDDEFLRYRWKYNDRTVRDVMIERFRTFHDVILMDGEVYPPNPAHIREEIARKIGRQLVEDPHILLWRAYESTPMHWRIHADLNVLHRGSTSFLETVLPQLDIYGDKFPGST